MSWFETESFTCPRCSGTFTASTADTINVTRMPSARDRILDGTFHRFGCETCGETITIDRTFLYSDLRREQFIHVFPVDHAGDWPQWEEIAGQTFWQAFTPAPPAMREVATRFRVRAVFGLAALADKLRAWDADLDDAIVETLKLELAATHPVVSTRTDAAIDIVTVGDELIEVAATSLTGAWSEERYGLRLSRYRELLAARGDLEQKFPGLFHKPYVGFRRLARETLAGVGA
jgi:hypothetical protein